METKQELLKRHWIFALVLGVVSAGVGWFWGSGAQILYTSNTDLPMFGNGVENPEWLGGLLGAVFGFAAGVFYTAKLASMLHDVKRGGRIFVKVISWGVLVGLACSSLVHAAMMLFYRNLHFGPMAIGAFFGIFSGAILGPVASGIFVACYSKKRNRD